MKEQVNFIEVLLVKQADETMSLLFKIISPTGELLNERCISISKDKWLEIWESVEGDSIPFSLGGIYHS